MKLQKIFNRLQGVWHFRRVLESRRKEQPSGVVQGKAEFIPTADKALHYKESGEFKTMLDKTKQELTVAINQQYLYRYNHDKDTLEKYFLENNGERFFYQLNFNKPTTLEKVLTAKAKHICAADTYEPFYEFPNDENFNTFTLIYRVKGPKKDYDSTTVYTKLQS